MLRDERYERDSRGSSSLAKKTDAAFKTLSPAATHDSPAATHEALQHQPNSSPPADSVPNRSFMSCDLGIFVDQPAEPVAASETKVGW